MKKPRLGVTITVLYLLLTALVIAGETHTRIYNTSNSEFAGIISLGLTLPTSVLMAWLLSSITGIQLGDSNIVLVTVLGVAAVLNALVIYFLTAGFSRLFGFHLK